MRDRALERNEFKSFVLERNEFRNLELECEELGRGILAAQMRAHRTAFGCIDVIFALLRRFDF